MSIFRVDKGAIIVDTSIVELLSCGGFDWSLMSLDEASEHQSVGSHAPLNPPTSLHVRTPWSTKCIQVRGLPPQRRIRKPIAAGDVIATCHLHILKLP